jgi:hypothetical protein
LWRRGRFHNHNIHRAFGRGDHDHRRRDHDVRTINNHHDRSHDDYHGPRHHDHRGTHHDIGFVPTGA